MIQFFSKTRNLLLLTMLASAALVRAQVALPYSQQFDDISDFETFTVANENNDEDLWRYDDIEQAAKSERNYDADDWLITPIFELEEGKTYELSFKSYIEMFGSESLAVFLGTSKRVSSFTTNILPLTAVTEESATVYTAVFTVEESDDYRIGFHHCTVGDPYSNYLFIDDISLRETISQQAPGPVTDLTVTPGEKGALSALVSMKAPVVAVDGSNLESITGVELYRDNRLILTFPNPQPGEALSFEDTAVTGGMHTYKAVAVNSQGPSDPVQAEAFIGVDQPGPVQNLHFTYDYDTHHAVVTWDAPSVGVHGGYIDTENLKYSIKRYMQPTGTMLAEGLTATSFEDEVDIEWLEAAAEIRYQELEQQYHYPVARTVVVDGQGLMYYYVKPVSETGEGKETTTETRIIGEPYGLPFIESFPDGFASHLWFKPVTPGRTRWYEISDNRFSQDGDNGFLAISTNVIDEMQTTIEETTRAQTGRLCLTDCNRPVMSLYYFYDYAMDRPLKIKVSTDGVNFDTVAELDMGDESLARQYIRAVVPLDAIAGQPSCYVALETTLTNTVELVYVDNIMIYNQYEDDLTARITRLPAYLRSGEPRTVRVAVTNLGSNEVPENAYTVEVYAQGQKAGSINGPAIKVGDLVEVMVPVTATAGMPQQTGVYAVVEYPADNNTDNNTTRTDSLQVRYPSYPVPQNLSWQQGVLSWMAPQPPRTEESALMEGFEQYDDFTISDLGDWVLVDRDQSLTYSWGENYIWPNRTLPHAFIVMNPSEVVLGTGGKGLDDIWSAYDGEKMLMSSSFMADDWLISPELSGRAQTISFYARCTNSFTETFNVCASATDTEPESFTDLGSEVSVKGAAWVKYEYNLPEGTRYFAIHRTSYDGNKFFVDDVSFVPEYLAQQDIALMGYRIYNHGELVGETSAGQQSYNTDFLHLNDAEFTVTAVYDQGESAPSNPVYVESGIEQLTVQSAHRTDGVLYDLQGRRATGKLKGIYIRDHRKVVIP